MENLNKKYKLALEELGARVKCPVPAPNCKNFKRCDDCWDYFFQCEVERIKHLEVEEEKPHKPNSEEIESMFTDMNEEYNENFFMKGTEND